MHGTIEKAQQVRTIIFPNLFDERSTLISGAKEVVEYLRKREYWLKLAANVLDGTENDCREELKRQNIDHCFEDHIVRPDVLKLKMLYQLITKGDKIDLENVNFEKIAVIDDRTAKGYGLNWGFVHGATTIWLRQGKFAHELPPENQPPTYIIDSLDELKGIFKQKAARR